MVKKIETRNKRKNRLAHLCSMLLITLSFLGAQNPGKTWQKYRTPEEAGWSSKQLKELYNRSRASAMMIVHNGKVAAVFGDIKRRYKCHSVRKSFLNALYGIYVNKGVIKLDKTIGELGIKARIPLTEMEQRARVRHLLQSRSGIYIPSAAETAYMKKNRPQRGSHSPGTFWYYNNWDFNVLGTIFNQETGKDIFREFKKQIAMPLQMEDFRLMDGTYDYGEDNSLHPSYPFKMSARDMARFGLLYLQGGSWNDKQILTEKWINETIKPYTEAADTQSCGYGYLWYTCQDLNGSPYYFASGVGGQFIGVFPSEKVVIVLRADTYTGESIRNRLALIKGIFNSRPNNPLSNPHFVPLDADKHDPGVNPIPLSQSELAKYSGKYLLKDNEFSIKSVPGGLILEKYHYFYKFNLLPLSRTKFFVEDIREFLYFTLDSRGRPTAVDIHKTEANARIYHLFKTKGLAAGIGAIRDFRNEIKKSSDLRLLADRLKGEGKIRQALAVLRLNVLFYPGMVNNHRRLINLYMADSKASLKGKNRVKELSNIYTVIAGELKKEPDINANDLAVLEWYREWLQARANPVPVSIKEIKSITGGYGPRHVIVRKGRLTYYREGKQITYYPMVKLAANLYALDDDYPDIVRIKFVSGKNSQAAKMIFFTLTGFKDELDRNIKK
jgi:CubicO group peptidase (beta-lactamase class C family)